MDQSQRRARHRQAFALGIGAPIMILGAVAIFGPEAAHVAVNQTVGLLLIGAGGLGLLNLLRPGSAERATRVWSLVAVAVGVALMLVPRHGIVSFGVLVGLLLLAHGGAAMAVVWPHRSSRRMVFVLGSVVGLLLIMVGVALLAGETFRDRLEGVVIGVDMEMFAIYVIFGRELIETASRRSPSTSSR